MVSTAEPLILGVDGGQTTTVGLLAATSGRILGAGRAGPSNHLREKGGETRLRSAVEQAAEALAAGAYAVVVGTAITAPAAITQRFAQALSTRS